ncbi:MAG: beta-ketoacyl synthase [Desulfobacca sp.]|nr:beta-ketoacyl synthase [Desulfobacca sp.]
MTDCFLGADNTITSLGFSTAELVENIKADRTGISPYPSGKLSPTPVALSLVDFQHLQDLFPSSRVMTPSVLQPDQFTRLESLHILSISEVLKISGINLKDPRTLIILSTTKGNIDLLEKDRYPAIDPERLYLWKLAEVLQIFFGNPNKPLVVSNACISGVLAILIGSRLIKTGLYDHILVTGGDLVTEFVVSGFQSFQSLSPGPCKPFDRDRDGLSLGEGCSTIVLSRDHSLVGIPEKIFVAGGASSNDAHHLSGPSRTGEGLFLAIRRALKEAALLPEDLDYISAHGTATHYNDEMEARAFSRAGLESIPSNSFKGYLGHTLGAAGVIESALVLHSMKKNTLFKSAGFKTPGTSKPINILKDHISKECQCCLKTASGFGGCNGALIFKKM